MTRVTGRRDLHHKIGIAARCLPGVLRSVISAANSWYRGVTVVTFESDVHRRPPNPIAVQESQRENERGVPRTGFGRMKSGIQAEMQRR